MILVVFKELGEDDKIGEILKFSYRAGCLNHLDKLAIETSPSCKELDILEESNGFAFVKSPGSDSMLLISGCNADNFSHELDCEAVFEQIALILEMILKILLTERLDTFGKISKMLGNFLKVLCDKLPTLLANRLRTLINVDLILPTIKSQKDDQQGKAVESKRLTVRLLNKKWIIIEDSQNWFNFTQLSFQVIFTLKILKASLIAQDLNSYGEQLINLVESAEVMFRDYENIGMMIDHKKMQLVHFSNNLEIELTGTLNFDYIKDSWKNTLPMDIYKLFKDDRLLEKIEDMMAKRGGLSSELEVIQQKHYTVVFTKFEWGKRVEKSEREQSLQESSGLLITRSKIFSAVNRSKLLNKFLSSDNNGADLDAEFLLKKNSKGKLSRRQTLVIFP